ncbi:MAG: DUF1572 family protein [Planctomycetota bacterium]
MHQYEQPTDLPPVAAARVVFVRQKAFVEHCVKQLNDHQFFTELYPGLNSVGVIMQHLAGNMLSRWTDFLSLDGEKDWRDRESEFARPAGDPRTARRGIEAVWEDAWATLYTALTAAENAPPNQTVRIRGVPHSIPMALARQLDHYGFHIGQIATIARGLVGTEHWQWFTVAPGGSREFNQSLGYDTDDGGRAARD